MALIGAGIAFGFLSHASRVDEGRDTSLLEVAAAGLVIVVLPILGLLVRRSHPGWTFWLLLPAILVSLSPLLWLGDAVRGQRGCHALDPRRRDRDARRCTYESRPGVRRAASTIVAGLVGDDPA